MHRKARVLLGLVSLLVTVISLWSPALAEKPIIIGAPLSTAFLYGWDAERGIKLAVDEINAAGGVKVGQEKRPFQVDVIDTRDLEPGVPVSEALLAVEKLILEKKADFLIGGPVRSEAALAAIPLLSKHKKISILTTGALTPKYHEMVASNPDKFKYCFRISGEAKWMVTGEVVPCLEKIGKDFGLNRLLIMVQDVAHARAGGGLLAKIMTGKGWTVLGEPLVFPTGSGDFSMGLLEAKKQNAQVILIWMDMPESSILLKQWHDMKVPALPFGTIIAAAEQPGFWDATDGKGEYCLANVVNAGNTPCEATPWTMKFVNAYKAKYGLEPEGYGTSSSYMAVYTLKDAIERAGTLDPDKVTDALKATDLEGVYGRIRFDPKSNQVIPSTNPKEGAVGTIFQWQDKKRVVVFPESIATGKILLPPWMEKK
ncbi:ABC transporter substrate-binding protein [Desulfomonile tiedjei]|uniref:Amino acid/amide ABC transporter substrate-binding protein, HAAT family n=1 Tax=Desulfomonile tiedjei (strain ATCC 49306 / DSM 6799 / DCB-1) TaxID=706587 RepID=I4C234_DESTA|nr:ABC transporter substrate-binding protein [Desulfomonile tiedjei]AFM23625.1 amino acid/amide ABC transporter substrate-binding protein, HAAT family [Desulfomonile tiedjei DSM 6799]